MVLAKFIGNQKNVSVIETDIDGNILYINSQYSMLSSYSKSDLVGSKNIYKVDLIQNSILDSIKNKIALNRVWIGTAKNITKENKEYWTNTTVYIHNNKVIFISTLATQKDIENAKRMNGL